MIYLKSTTQKLEFVLAGAITTSALEVSVHYFNVTPQLTTTERRGGVQRATSNNTTDVAITDAPELPGIIRNIHTIFIHNKDTVTATVTVKIDDSGTETILVKQSIAAGESLIYEDGRGWDVLSPITPPFVDTTPIVKGSVDSTKLLRIEVDGITASTTRTWTAADADIVVAGSAAAMTTGRVVYSTTGGLLTADGNFLYDGTTLTVSKAMTVTPANANVTISPTGTGTVTINPATLGNIDNTRIGFTTRAAIQATTGDFNSTLTFATKVVSDTSAAVGAALSATAYRAFANVTYGAALMGFGTTADWALMQRSGAAVLYGEANTSNAFSAGIFKPDTNNTLTLGTSGLRWSTIYGVDGNFSGNVTLGDATSDTVLVYGQIGIGRTPTAVANSASLEMDATTNLFQRFYIANVEKHRITSTATALDIAATTGLTITMFGGSTAATFNSTGLSIANSLIVSGTGPHAIGGATSVNAGLFVRGAFAPSSATDGWGTLFDQTLTAVAGSTQRVVAIDGTINKAGSGTHTDFIGLELIAPVIGAGAATLTNATTLKITGAPSVGTNQRSLWVAAGLSQFDGAITATSTLSAAGITDSTKTSGRVTYFTTGGLLADSNQFTFGTGLTLGTALTYGGVTLSNAVTGTGNMVLSASPTISGTLTVSGGQIAFPATQSASADANTLDDYEEGTWTPSVGGSATYTSQEATYTKIGRAVFVRGRLVINTIGTGSTSAISGLPFTSAAAGDSVITIGHTDNGLAVNVVSIVGVVGGTATSFTLKSRTAASVTDATNAVITSGTDLSFSGTYHV